MGSLLSFLSGSGKEATEQTLEAPTRPTSTLPLWDRTNPDQQLIVSKHQTYKHIFRGRLADLREYVQPDLLWVHLIDLEVIDRQTRDQFLSNATAADAVERLVHHLDNGPTWKLHSFLRALALRDHPEIIELLGFREQDYQAPPAPCQPPPSLNPAATNQTKTHKPHYYTSTFTRSSRHQADQPPPSLDPAATKQTKTHKPHYYRSVESEEVIQISNELLPGLLQHCGSYNQTLLKTSLFGFKKNVPIDLTQLYVCHDASCRKNLREKLPIRKMELFQQLFGRRCPNCLSMEGPAGAGKSSYLENYAYEWSQDFSACEQSDQNIACKGHLWKLVVYISSGAIRGSAIDAIRDNLRCEPHLQGTMMCAIQEDGDGVVLLYDAMDELRNKKSIASISSYTQTSQGRVGKPKVLLAARHGLLSVERSFFDRELYLEGFSVSQGLLYMGRYFAEMHSLTTHPILDHLKAHPEDLGWVLTNPLTVHILSELTACGFLKLEDVKSLTTVKLFNSLDQLLIQRDNEIRPTQPTDPRMFYQACLRCILTDTRTLSEEDVGRESPYLSMLQRHEYMGQDFNNCCSFSFPHEMLVEFFGVKGLVQCLKSDVGYKHSMLLYLSSQHKMRNVLLLTCGYIGQYEPELLPNVVFIIRACLVLQPGNVLCEQNELTQELLQLPSLIKATFPPSVLTNGLTTEQAAKLAGISSLIQAVFMEKAPCLKETTWFLNGYPKDSGIRQYEFCHEFIRDCLQQLTHQQQLEVCSRSTHRILPCTGYNVSVRRGDATVTVVPTNGVRWAVAIAKTYGSDGVRRVGVYLQSVCDLVPALNTWRQLHTAPLKSLSYVVYNVHILHTKHTLPGSVLGEELKQGVRELLSPTYCTRAIFIPYQQLPGPLLPLPLSPSDLCIPLCIAWVTVSEEELTEFCTWAAGEGHLRLELWYLRVVLRAGRGKEDWKDVDAAIRRMVEVEVGGEKGQLYKPTYMTSSGEVLCEQYRP